MSRQANRKRLYSGIHHCHLLAVDQVERIVQQDAKLLDVVALSVIVTSAGSAFTDLEGQPLGLDTRSILAASNDA